MDDRREDIIAKLEKSGADTVAFFQSLKPEELKKSVYQEGAAWTVKQVLAHFITIEGSMQRLFKNILDGGPGSPADFDVERFNRTQPRKLDHLSIGDLIARFQAVRSETVAIVAGMSDKDLDREGRHAYHGHGRLDRFIRWAYEHVEEHEADIRQVLTLK